MNDLKLFLSDRPIDAIMLRALQAIGTLRAVAELLPAEHIELVRRMKREIDSVEAHLMDCDKEQ